jgi:hypothetical protein
MVCLEHVQRRLRNSINCQKGTSNNCHRLSGASNLPANDSALFSFRFCAVHPKDVSDCQLWQFFEVPKTRKDKWNTSALLCEPYGARVEWFNLDELEKRGRVETRGYVILSPEQWTIERDALLEKLSKKKVQFPPLDTLEIEYRSVLKLPNHGPLSKSEIEYAYRTAAKSSHPDVGGNEKDFKRVSEAKDALVARGFFGWPKFD